MRLTDGYGYFLQKKANRICTRLAFWYCAQNQSVVCLLRRYILALNHNTETTLSNTVPVT